MPNLSRCPFCREKTAIQWTDKKTEERRERCINKCGYEACFPPYRAFLEPEKYKMDYITMIVKAGVAH